MKTTRLAAALVAAFGAASAFAANVEVYGAIDLGLTYQHNDYAAQKSDSSFKMMSGQWIGSRFGIKASEDLGHGVKVGVALENGFSADTGVMRDDRLFARDSRIYIDSEDFGYLSFGRMGVIFGGNGPFARFGHVVSPFSCGWGDIGGSLQITSLANEFVDNAIGYTTPKFAGFDASVQYSFGTDGTVKTGTEGKSSVDRFASGAVRYQNDRFLASVGVETYNWAQPAADDAKLDDAVAYSLGGHYDAGFAKFYLLGHYFENYKMAAKTTTFKVASGVDGYGVNVGASIPVLGGYIKAGFGYGDFEGSQKDELTMKTYQTSVGYTYEISRRTSVYTGASWIKSKYSEEYKADNASAKEDVYLFTAGLVHRF